MLLPIRLDGADLNSDIDWTVTIQKRRHITSFENWDHSPHYKKMLNDLLKDLRKE